VLCREHAAQPLRDNLPGRSCRVSAVMLGHMTEFKVVVGGVDSSVAGALAQAKIKTARPHVSGHTGEQLEDTMDVFVEAESADAAVARVREHLPPSGRYVILSVT
jgi:NH3-dependent NAD+ synthetase